MFNRDPRLTKKWLLGIVQSYQEKKRLWKHYSQPMQILVALTRAPAFIALHQDDDLPAYMIERIMDALDLPCKQGSKSKLIIKQIKQCLQDEKNTQQITLHNEINYPAWLLSNKLWRHIFSLVQTKQAYFSLSLTCRYFYTILSVNYRPPQITKKVQLTCQPFRHYSNGAARLGYFSPHQDLMAQISCISYSLFWGEKITIYYMNGEKLKEINSKACSRFSTPAFSCNLNWLLVYEFNSECFQIWDIHKNELCHQIKIKLLDKSEITILPINREEFVIAYVELRKINVLMHLNATTGEFKNILETQDSIVFLIACNKFSFVCAAHHHSGAYFRLIKFSNQPTVRSVSARDVTLFLSPDIERYTLTRFIVRRLDAENLIFMAFNVFYKVRHDDMTCELLTGWMDHVFNFDVIGQRHIVILASHGARKLLFCNVQRMVAEDVSSEIYELIRRSEFGIGKMHVNSQANQETLVLENWVRSSYRVIDINYVDDEKQALDLTCVETETELAPPVRNHLFGRRY